MNPRDKATTDHKREEQLRDQEQSGKSHDKAQNPPASGQEDEKRGKKDERILGTPRA